MPAAPGMAAHPMGVARTASSLYELWLDLSSDPSLALLQVAEGSLLEVGTFDVRGIIDGSAAFVVRVSVLALQKEHLWT